MRKYEEIKGESREFYDERGVGGGEGGGEGCLHI